MDEQLDDGTANITVVNGTKSVVINGTLENGTDGAATAAGAASGVGAVKGGLKAVWPVAVVVGGLMYAL